MKKIPTVFVRDPEDMRYLLREVHPDCQWVLDGEGTPTRKYDGTCTKYDGTRWWARREVKPGKTPPPGFVAEQTDDVTDKTVGWEPAEQSAFRRYLDEAIDTARRVAGVEDFSPGTYELCGPKVQGNPEGYANHRLIFHDAADLVAAPRDYDGLEAFLRAFPHEGIVWHHRDGRMAKIKRRDFRP